jgi:hypothetical protein
MRLKATVRSRIAPAALVGLGLVAALGLVTTTGCTHAEVHPQTTAVDVPTPTPGAAGDAGGACYLLEYEVIEQTVGTSFDVAAASQVGTTFSCVLQRAKSISYPDLTLTVSPTDADSAAFKTTVPPKGAAPVTELGKVGYSAALAPTPDAGPAVEVGWLSGNGRILVLRYRCPMDTPDDVGALTPKLVALAKKIDQAST